MYPESMPGHFESQLPQFTLRQIDLPEVGTWEVNGEYYVIMKVKMIGKRDQRVSDSPQDANKIEGEFQVNSIRALGDKPVDAKGLAQTDWENTVAKAKSGAYNGQ